MRNAVRIFDRRAYKALGQTHVHIFSPARLKSWHPKQHGQKNAKQPKSRISAKDYARYSYIACNCHNKNRVLSTMDAQSAKHCAPVEWRPRCEKKIIDLLVFWVIEDGFTHAVLGYNFWVVDCSRHSRGQIRSAAMVGIEEVLLLRWRENDNQSREVLIVPRWR